MKVYTIHAVYINLLKASSNYSNQPTNHDCQFYCLGSKEDFWSELSKNKDINLRRPAEVFL